MATTLEDIRKKLQQAQQDRNAEAVSQIDPAEKKRRLKRLKELFARLKSGEDITRRDLKNALVIPPKK
jgi:DNA-binding protein H-NS